MMPRSRCPQEQTAVHTMLTTRVRGGAEAAPDLNSEPVTRGMMRSVTCTRTRRNALAGCISILSLFSCAGCMATIGTVLSPLTGTVDIGEMIVEGRISWGAAPVVPLLLIMSPFAGFLAGLEADLELVDSDSWEYTRKSALYVMKPWSTVL